MFTYGDEELDVIDLLDESIEQWECIVQEPDDAFYEEEYFHECPLCEAFPTCNGCPIQEATGLDGCSDTPYYQTRVSEADDICDKAATAENDEAMLDYLIDLRERLLSGE